MSHVNLVLLHGDLLLFDSSLISRWFSNTELPKKDPPLILAWQYNWIPLDRKQIQPDNLVKLVNKPLMQVNHEFDSNMWNYNERTTADDLRLDSLRATQVKHELILSISKNINNEKKIVSIALDFNTK